jgi:hypothetical protein
VIQQFSSFGDTCVKPSSTLMSHGIYTTTTKYKVLHYVVGTSEAKLIAGILRLNLTMLSEDWLYRLLIVNMISKMN